MFPHSLSVVVLDRRQKGMPIPGSATTFDWLKNALTAASVTAWGPTLTCPCSMYVVASVSVSDIFSLTITTGNRRLSTKDSANKIFTRMYKSKDTLHACEQYTYTRMSKKKDNYAHMSKEHICISI